MGYSPQDHKQLDMTVTLLSRVCASHSITDSRDMNFEQTPEDSVGQRRLVGYSPGVAKSQT